MPKKQCAIAILAAGKGSRLKIEKPKALAPLLGQTLLDFTTQVIDEFDQSSELEIFPAFVLGHQKSQIIKHLEKKNCQYQIAIQEEQLGTGHALQCYFKELPENVDRDYTMVTCVDTPLITPDIYEMMINKIESDSELKGVAVSFEASNPFGYGRIKREGKGFRVIEEKDASASEQNIHEVNSGLYLFKTSYVLKHLNNLKNENNSGEFYLTDLFTENEKVEVIKFKDEKRFLGINTLEQLSIARSRLRDRKIQQWREEGVLIEDENSFFFDWNVTLKPGVRIEPSISLKGNTTIDSGTSVESFTIINDSIIDKDVCIKGHSHIEEAKISSGAAVGPYARLRPGAELESNVKVGNFVEIKKAILRKGAKASHLSYIGDADIGEDSNLGCGFITCNYDGANKHKTTIGKGVFIGSDCQMIAPVEIGDHSFIAAGSTINKSLPENSFAIARSRQTTKENMGDKFIKKKESK